MRVLLFGAEAQAVGGPWVEVLVGEGARVEEVVRALASQHPALMWSMGHARLARNHEFARGEDVVGEGDELALIGLVSGG